jgi:hypothetical protein
VLFANLHNSKGGSVKHVNKMVAVPVPVDKRAKMMATLTDVPEGSGMATIVRGNNFNRPVYHGDLRVGLLKEAHAYLSARNSNFSQPQMNEYDKFAGEQLVARGEHRHDEQAASQYEEDKDPVERNRNKLEVLKSVFLPEGTFMPASDFIPTNFLRSKGPYSKTMPIFFPNGNGDKDDPNRVPAIKEQEWVLHMLRNVRKTISESPLFTFTAAYRLDTLRMVGAYNSLVGFLRTPAGEVRRSKDDMDKFQTEQFNITGSRDYYRKQAMDINAYLGLPRHFLHVHQHRSLGRDSC